MKARLAGFGLGNVWFGTIQLWQGVVIEYEEKVKVKGRAEGVFVLAVVYDNSVVCAGWVSVSGG